MSPKLRSQQIPMKVSYAGRNKTAYMDPILNIVHHLPVPVPCNFLSIPLTLNGSLMLYSPRDGRLTTARHVTPLTVFNASKPILYNHPLIFDDIGMYGMHEVLGQDIMSNTLSLLSERTRVWTEIADAARKRGDMNDDASIVQGYISYANPFSFFRWATISAILSTTTDVVVWCVIVFIVIQLLMCSCGALTSCVKRCPCFESCTKRCP